MLTCAIAGNGIAPTSWTNDAHSHATLLERGLPSGATGQVINRVFHRTVVTRELLTFIHADGFEEDLVVVEGVVDDDIGSKVTKPDAVRIVNFGAETNLRVLDQYPFEP